MISMGYIRNSAAGGPIFVNRFCHAPFTIRNFPAAGMTGNPGFSEGEEIAADRVLATPRYRPDRPFSRTLTNA